MDSQIRQVLQREILERCNEEEREAVERWFKSFQAIGLSKLNGMSVARGTTMSCPLYWAAFSRMHEKHGQQSAIEICGYRSWWAATTCISQCCWESCHSDPNVWSADEFFGHAGVKPITIKMIFEVNPKGNEVFITQIDLIYGCSSWWRP